MSFFKKSTLAGLAFIALAGAAQAATFTMTSSVASFAPIADPLNPVAPTVDGTGKYNNGVGQYEIQLFIEVSGLTASEGFGAIDFKWQNSGAVLNPVTGAYAADAKTVDSNGSVAGGVVPLWNGNEDFAIAPTSGEPVVNVAVSAFTTADPRRYVGQPLSAQGSVRAADRLTPPVYFGSILVNVAGTGAVSFTPVADSTRNTTTGQLATNQFPAYPFSVPAPIQFVAGDVPEPATLSLAAIAGLGLVRRRRA